MSRRRKRRVYKEKSFWIENFRHYFIEIFRSIIDGPIKSDFWRACVLFRYGGVYVDVDIEHCVPVSSLIQDGDEFVTCLSTFPNSYNPHFIMTKPYARVLFRCIETYLNYYFTKKPYT